MAADVLFSSVLPVSVSQGAVLGCLGLCSFSTVADSYHSHFVTLMPDVQFHAVIFRESVVVCVSVRVSAHRPPYTGISLQL